MSILVEKMETYIKLSVNSNINGLVKFINVTLTDYLSNIEKQKLNSSYGSVKSIKDEIEEFLEELTDKFLIDYSFSTRVEEDNSKLHVIIALTFPLKDETRAFTYIVSLA